MKFNSEKKNRIILYLLEKISQNSENIVKNVAEEFNVNQTTIHSYINELTEDNVIQRVKRGKYRLIETTKTYELKRGEGHLDSDIYAYNTFFKKHIDDLPDNIQEIWQYAFSEMINNVMDHSQAEKAIVYIQRNYLRTIVMIDDNGVGIFEKIKEHFKFPSLDDAICELFKGKLTTDSKNHSGEGIFFTSKIMDEFIILSSKKIFTNNKFDNSLILNSSVSNHTGTCVMMAISNHTHKKAREVFDMYSSVDGGFHKTTIPLKNIFDSAPVSRSQARRVCNRLSKFKEATLDFATLEWMGQGFAHQIFVVFKNEHPEIKIIPINMNEDITKMYNHVILGD